MTKNAVSYSVLVGVLLWMGYWGMQAYHQALVYEETTAQLVASNDAAQQVSLHFDKMAKELLGDWYSDDLNQERLELQAKQEDAQRNAKVYTLYFMCLLLVVLFSYFWIPLRAFTFLGSLAAMMTLLFGLFTPILMVTIHKEFAYVGDIVLSFESKGVLGSIIKLYRGGDVFVAGVILLFSVLVPLAKVFSLLFVSVFMESKFAHGIIGFFKSVGKWSMVDVFVVAVFLVFLTANNAQISHAEVEVGLYFFLAYVLVSMVVSLSADKMLLENNPIR